MLITRKHFPLLSSMNSDYRTAGYVVVAKAFKRESWEDILRLYSHAVMKRVEMTCEKVCFSLPSILQNNSYADLKFSIRYSIDWNVIKNVPAEVSMCCRKLLSHASIRMSILIRGPSMFMSHLILFKRDWILAILSVVCFSEPQIDWTTISNNDMEALTAPKSKQKTLLGGGEIKRSSKYSIMFMQIRSKLLCCCPYIWLASPTNSWTFAFYIDN